MRRPSLERGWTRRAWLVARRVRRSIANPMGAARSAAVFLNVPPFTSLFRALYGLGLRCVVARLARHPFVHAILGHGSYFRGGGLFGYSDIDLVIVFRREARRSEGVQFPIARTYGRVRRLFPFLGSWDEKEGSLIFLNELEEGFQPHATFRIRMLRDEFVLLHGESVPKELVGPPLSPADWVLEIDRLLRWAVLTGEDMTERLLFWQRMFSKLRAAVDGLGLSALAPAFETPDLAFLREAPRRLYFRSVRPEEPFQRLLALVDRVMESVRAASEPVTVVYRPVAGGLQRPRAVPVPESVAGARARAAWAGPSVPIGFQPRLFYFSIDEPIVVIELEGDSYRGLRTILGRLEARGEPFEAVVAKTAGFLFLFSREPEFVDLIPLDPLLCASAYALLDGSPELTVPESIHAPARAEAEVLFSALRDSYRRHTGRLPKHSAPSIYREDDLDTIRDAFDILRAYLAHAQGVHVTSSEDLVRYLGRRFPGATAFLTELVAYRAFLERGGRGRAPANNLYRCLHRFVAEVLDGAEDVEIDDFDRRLGITVGIITRNRARDLQNALESLTMQDRVPDEVVIVDNGSTDGTREVISGFARRLPVRYLHLSEASIPIARNLVLEHATQEIVSFTDDDCAIPREWLSSVERGFLRADNVGIVGGWVEHWPAARRTTVDAYYEIFHNHKT